MCSADLRTIVVALFVVSQLLSWIIQVAGEFCEAYVDEAGTYHTSFHCPNVEAWGQDQDNIYCCGTSTTKYCCSQPTGYFLENFNIGAFVGGSLAIIIAVIIGIIICCCCCSCCLWNRRQTRRRSVRNNGPGRSAVAYNAPRAAVTTTPILHEAPRTTPPKAVPNSYPKQHHYSPHAGLAHNHQANLQPHATPPLSHHQPYTPPHPSHAPSMVTAGEAIMYPGSQPSPHMDYSPQRAYVPPVVHTQQMQPGAAIVMMDHPPPYAPSAEPVQMTAPPLLDKGGYHLQGDMAGPSAPPEPPPPAGNPHYH